MEDILEFLLGAFTFIGIPIICYLLAGFPAEDIAKYCLTAPLSSCESMAQGRTTVWILLTLMFTFLGTWFWRSAKEDKIRTQLSICGSYISKMKERYPDLDWEDR